MEEFFNYRPRAIGVVIDVGERSKLSLTKGALVDFISGFSTDIDDKVYVYDPKHIKLPNWLSEAVANVANYKEAYPFQADAAMKQSVAAISQARGDYDRHVIYITDRSYPSQKWKIEAGPQEAARLGLECNFVVLTFSKASWDALGELYDAHQNMQMGLVGESDNLLSLMKEAIQ